MTKFDKFYGIVDNSFDTRRPRNQESREDNSLFVLMAAIALLVIIYFVRTRL